MRHAISTAALIGALAFGIGAVSSVHAATKDPDVARLSAQLEQLSADPELGQYALAQQVLARNAINDLQDAGRSAHDHALFMAEQRVALAQASAKTEADRVRLDQLRQEHDQIMLQASQADAAAARAELARQRLQYEAAVQQAQMLQQQGAQATQQAQQAQAEAEQAKKLAAAQARAATLARKEARLAEAATKALQGGGDSGASANSGSGHASGSGSLQLSAASFQSGSDNLSASGQRRVANFGRAHAGQKIIVAPRASSSDRVLTGRRAMAVQQALADAGTGPVTVWKVASAAQGMEVEIRTQK